jgi:hypothetical protein
MKLHFHLEENMKKPHSAAFSVCVFLFAFAFFATDPPMVSAKSKEITDDYGNIIAVGPPPVVCIGNTIPILIEIPAKSSDWVEKELPKGKFLSASHGTITPGDSDIRWGGHLRFYYTATSAGKEQLMFTYSASTGNKKTTPKSFPLRSFEVKSCIYKITITGEDRRNKSGFIEATFFRASGCISAESNKVEGKVKSYVDFSAVGNTAAMTCSLYPKQEASSTIDVTGDLKKSAAQKAGEAMGMDYLGTATFNLALSYETFLKFPASKLTCTSLDSKVKIPVPYARKESWSPPDDGFKEQISLELNDIQDFPFGKAGTSRYFIKRVENASGCGDK